MVSRMSSREDLFLLEGRVDQVLTLCVTSPSPHPEGAPEEEGTAPRGQPFHHSDRSVRPSYGDLLGLLWSSEVVF